MGLRMDNIHMPTIRFGDASPNKASDRTPLLELMTEKDRIQSELSALGSVLESHNVNMNTSLITFDGFPRDDIDIAQIRATRARIIYLGNDYKAIMARIEKGLHEYHAGLAPSSSEAQGCSHVAGPARSSAGPDPKPEVALQSASFAKVNSIVAGSPADDAGLKAGDEIRQFGDVNWMNHEKLSKVAVTVQKNEGRILMVKVMRRGTMNSGVEEHELWLTPRSNWGGRGMLGCHLLPI